MLKFYLIMNLVTKQRLAKYWQLTIPAWFKVTKRTFGSIQAAEIIMFPSGMY